MIVCNYYTKELVEYPVNLDLHILNYHIRHETPFTDRYSEWAVSVLDNGDIVYLPYGDNRCSDVYIVSHHGIFTISFNSLAIRGAW